MIQAVIPSQLPYQTNAGDANKREAHFYTNGCLALKSSPIGLKSDPCLKKIQAMTFLSTLPPSYFTTYMSPSPTTYKRSLPMHLVNTAKMIIPRLWHSTTVPEISDWFRRIDQVGELRKQVHISRETMFSYVKT